MLFNDESELLDLEKELNEIEGLESTDKKRGESKADDSKPGMGSSGGYGRHAAPSGTRRPGLGEPTGPQRRDQR